ncbi:hypothetical protein [Gulosibacter sediminis]|uniref:hypothetical protein n=1 Tax=Gulosibacter sediminis TaxID=1729695 RepID=UPI0024A80D43|nr:hypothetical protein [Gulosibacter sediminis]
MAWTLRPRAPRDTGMWDITSLVQAPVDSGGLFIQRVDNVTFVSADNLRVNATGTITLAGGYTLPAGVRAQRTLPQNIMAGNGGRRRLLISPLGALTLYYMEAGDVMHFVTPYPVSADFPTMMPGVKV